MSDPGPKAAADSNPQTGKQPPLPTSYSALQRRTQPRRPIPSRFLKGLLGDINLGQIGIGFALVAIVALLVARISFTRLPPYQVGEMAHEDFVTSADLTIANQDLTRLEQDKAASQVPIVFDYDPNVLKNILNQFHDYWEQSRGILASPAPPAQKRPALMQQFQKEFGEPPSPQLLATLRARRFDAGIELQMANILGAILRAGVVNHTGVISQGPLTNKVVLRNIDTNSETVLSNSTPVRSLTQAREQCRDQLLQSRILPRNALEDFCGDIENLITINGLYNQHDTMERRAAAVERVRSVLIQIPARTAIIRAGEPVTAEAVQALNALRQRESRRRRPAYFMGLYLAVLLFFFFIWRFILQRSRSEISVRRQFLLISMTVVVMLILTRLLLFTAEMVSENFSYAPFNDPFSSKFAIPYAAGAMLVTLLLDANVGMIFAVFFSLFVGYVARTPFLAIYSLVSSMAAIYAVRQYQDRNAILKASLIVGLTNFLIVLGLGLLEARPGDWRTLFFDFGNTLVGGFFVAGCVSLLLPMFESLFDICTDVRLLELSNLNLPVLRRLAAEAPGTYHHSILVGILAEAAAEAIGANSLLARVACLYHDIGKMVKPAYYIENSREATQRHEQLAPSMSSLVIIDHVKEGMELAKQIHLPRRVLDIIPQHHGTSLVTYFYHKAIKEPEADEVGITEEQFRYPGPRPKSKEAALIMLADSIEAASRTVDDPNPKKLQNVVDRIVERFMGDHQLDDSMLTLSEISSAKQAFTKALAGIYHQRIAYPGYDFNESHVEASAG